MEYFLILFTCDLFRSSKLVEISFFFTYNMLVKRHSDIFEHGCLQNINKLYKHAGGCDGQQQFKDILEFAMVSTLEGFTNNSPRSPMTPPTLNKPSAEKSLCLFINILDMKNKIAIRRVGAAKSKRKAIKTVTTPYPLKQKNEE